MTLPDLERSLEPPPQRTPFRPVVAAIMGGVASGGAVAIFSGDSACGAIGAALIAAAVCGIAAFLVGQIAARRGFRVRAVIAAIVVAIAIAQVLWVRASLRAESFRTAFGKPMPAAIEDYRVRRYYAGGPGDTVTLMRFRASAETMEALLAGIPIAEDDDLLIREFEAGRLSAQELWRDRFNMANHRSARWWPADAPALVSPRLHHQPASFNRPPPTTVRILHDRATGEVYVLITAG